MNRNCCTSLCEVKITLLNAYGTLNRLKPSILAGSDNISQKTYEIKQKNRNGLGDFGFRWQSFA